MVTFSGKCLCGSVSYESDSEPAFTANCHCADCRAATGAAYSTISFFQAGDLKIEEGGDDIYVLDGSLFITPVDMLKSERRFWNEKSAAYINHYPRFFDIDSESDFMAADALLKHEWCLEGGTPGDHNLN